MTQITIDIELQVRGFCDLCKEKDLTCQPIEEFL